MELEISVDDGHELDKKMISLLDKYGLRATFYIPIRSWGIDNLDVYRDHEVGNHTYSHPSDLKLLTNGDLLNEIEGPHRLLNEWLGRKIDRFCPPRGRYNDKVVNVCRELGYKQLRTTRVLCTEKSKDIIQHTSIHVYQRDEYNGVDWFDVATDLLDKKPKYFHVWGHSAEIQKFVCWDKLERLLILLSDMK